YRAAGITTYSSTVFNFVPEQAAAFHAAVENDDRATTSEMLKSFFFPYVAIRNRRSGYAVSIVKAGLRAVGRDPGPVRPPLTDLTDSEQAALAQVIDSLR
ncbi:MAG: dihydrodipicolinate synthase family protein, partial [Pseudomonadales bacterium]